MNLKNTLSYLLILVYLFKYSQQQCLSGQFQNQHGFCQACDPLCTRCVENPTKCQACITENVRQEGESCLCVSGYYRNGASTCLQCGKCQEGYYTTRNTDCPDIVNDCTEKCDLKCKECETRSDYCTVCTVAQNRLNTPPGCECKEGFHDDDGKLLDCQVCMLNCVKCTNSSTCTQCQDGYYMEEKDCPQCTGEDNERKCVKKCETNFEFNKETNACESTAIFMGFQQKELVIYGSAILIALIFIYFTCTCIQQNRQKKMIEGLRNIPHDMSRDRDDSRSFTRSQTLVKQKSRKSKVIPESQQQIPETQPEQENTNNENDNNNVNQTEDLENQQNNETDGTHPVTVSARKGSEIDLLHPAFQGKETEGGDESSTVRKSSFGGSPLKRQRRKVSATGKSFKFAINLSKQAQKPSDGEEAPAQTQGQSFLGQIIQQHIQSQDKDSHQESEQKSHNTFAHINSSVENPNSSIQMDNVTNGVNNSMTHVDAQSVHSKQGGATVVNNSHVQKSTFYNEQESHNVSVAGSKKQI